MDLTPKQGRPTLSAAHLPKYTSPESPSAIGFGRVIVQEAPNHCYKASPIAAFILRSKLFEKCLALQVLLYLWSNNDISFDFCLIHLRREVLKVSSSGEEL